MAIQLFVPAAVPAGLPAAALGVCAVGLGAAFILGAIAFVSPTDGRIGIVVADMGRSLAFYRRLGMDIPEEADGEGHVDLSLPGGLRMSWDTSEFSIPFTVK